MDSFILVPCKDLDRGKSRLAGHLDPQSRRRLCEAFLRRTLELAIAVVSPEHVLLLSPDDRVRQIGSTYAVETLPDGGEGLNSALESARCEIVTRCSLESRVLVLPTDLPEATSLALKEILAFSWDIALVPDESEQGTNLLGLRAPLFAEFPFSFGQGSYLQHWSSAQRNGHVVYACRRPCLRFDVDQPNHYYRWVASNSMG